ncbi:hypothetical protein TUN199_07580 [Pyrenophora tritici-repentis]|nr:hypothetical protein Alg215_05213 [Pyrenophora tritici-repentis]KAI0612684.1 hypothetical protein TUN205_03047 [Pyrenophora tritici-repentis]KAI0620425.1 hypothetical protein TUN199_07580 [Pyrenophora tritici-repentis]KAI1515819.1 hypothetical protein Ptr86124_005820 [Pyrenophora tritici-repentis]KAI1684450.1 hypothetical protein KJE20_06955 [Pyrenophora tritici-repentis]
MSPVDGPELDFDEDAGFATAVDELNLCVVFGVLSEDDANPVAAELVTTVLLLDAVTSAAILVASTDPPVGNAPSTLPATLSITAVGTVTPLLDNTDDTSPTILDIKLPICLRCCSWTRRTRSAVTLPAARQCSSVVISMITRSGCDGRSEA